MKNLVFILYASVLLYFAYEVICISNKKQHLSYEIAELTSIKYGLFNVNIWKDKIAQIVVNNIDKYQITSENRENIKSHIELGFHKLLDELASFLENEKSRGNWFQKVVKNVVYGIAFDKESFKSQVPIWADEVIQLIENPDTQHQLKGYIKNRIVNLINVSKSLQTEEIYHKILKKYNYNESQAEECLEFINKMMANYRSKITKMSIVLLILCIVPFIFLYFKGSEIDGLIQYNLASLFVLLIVGLSIPMLSIDARLEKFELNLLGEQISFINQSLYYQSKSILQVAKLLLTSSSFNSIFSGFLIIVFSIVFPFTKLISYIFHYRLGRETETTNFFINKSGKWSMADVMVVSIILAFLGINNFLDNLLKLSTSTEDYINIIPQNNNSSLEMGLLFFIFYVLLSLTLSVPASSKSNKLLFENNF